MKLSLLQLQHIEDFQSAVVAYNKSIDRIRESARQTDRVGVVVDFAMPTPISVCHYVFKSVAIMPEDIAQAVAERKIAKEADAAINAEFNIQPQKQNHNEPPKAFGMVGRCVVSPTLPNEAEVVSVRNHANWCMVMNSDSETCTCGKSETMDA